MSKAEPYCGSALARGPHFGQTRVRCRASALFHLKAHTACFAGPQGAGARSGVPWTGRWFTTGLTTNDHSHLQSHGQTPERRAPPQLGIKPRTFLLWSNKITYKLFLTFQLNVVLAIIRVFYVFTLCLDCVNLSKLTKLTSSCFAWILWVVLFKLLPFGNVITPKQGFCFNFDK